MHRLTTLLSGIFLVFLTSWLGLVAYPALHLGRLTPVPDPDNGGSFPPTYGGQAIAGQRVYATEKHRLQGRLQPDAVECLWFADRRSHSVG